MDAYVTFILEAVCKRNTASVFFFGKINSEDTFDPQIISAVNKNDIYKRISQKMSRINQILAIRNLKLIQRVP